MSDNFEAIKLVYENILRDINRAKNNEIKAVVAATTLTGFLLYYKNNFQLNLNTFCGINLLTVYIIVGTLFFIGLVLHLNIGDLGRYRADIELLYKKTPELKPFYQPRNNNSANNRRTADDVLLAAEVIYFLMLASIVIFSNPLN